MFEKIIDILPSRKSPGAEWYDSGTEPESAVSGEMYGAKQAPDEPAGRGRVIIEKDMTLMMPPAAAPPMEKRRSLTEREIEEIVAASDDRYKLVSLLSEGGCAVDEISRYSGIPAGEVRLVMNLNRSRDTSENSQ